MADIDKVIRGWERCQKCNTMPLMGNIAYIECEYTTGLYCRKDKLISETLNVLKEQQNIVRCQDCKFSEKCEIRDLMLNHENGYCADGERKESKT